MLKVEGEYSEFDFESKYSGHTEFLNADFSQDQKEADNKLYTSPITSGFSQSSPHRVDAQKESPLGFQGMKNSDSYIRLINYDCALDMQGPQLTLETTPNIK